MVAFASREGADWIGFVFAKSPRQITPEAAQTLLMSVGRAVPVALLVDPTDEDAVAVARVGFPILQLHGGETDERIGELKALTGKKVWKSVGIGGVEDLKIAQAYQNADALLLDARPPSGSDIAGGHGQSFDWTLLNDWASEKPWILAGGLSPENVREAIRATGAKAVDVSSGVERIRGLKDRELVRAFIRAAKD